MSKLEIQHLGKKLAKPPSHYEASPTPLILSIPKIDEP